jgi:opacity protein-like surface antigen
MTSNGKAARFGGFSWLSVPRRSLLKAAVMAAAMFAAALAPAAVQAAPAQARAHVYLMRGVLNIFSLGMDQIAARLQQQGIQASVQNYLLWASAADEAAAEYKSGRAKIIILVGHSSGATVLPDMVARLSQQGVPVKLAIGLDSVFHTSLSGRVGRYINFYVANGAGTRVERSRNFQGTVENVDVEHVPGVGHLTIDKNELMQRKVIAAIDAAVASGPGAAPAAGPGAAAPVARKPVRAASPSRTSGPRRASAVN